MKSSQINFGWIFYLPSGSYLESYFYSSIFIALSQWYKVGIIAIVTLL